jgi:hypothetical protein
MSDWKYLPLDQIGYDPAFYPRVNGNADWLTIHRYKEALRVHPWKADANKTGAFPPVVVVKATGFNWPYLALDGVHRLGAFSGAGHERIAAIVERLPQSKWLERSVELNVDSKRPLDSGDKRWVATKLMADGWESDKVATLLCMEKGSFDKLMATSITKLTHASVKAIKPGRSNRQIGDDHFGFLKAPFAEVSGTANAQAALRSQSYVSSRDGLQIIESFIALLEAKCIDLTDESICQRLRKVGELVEVAIGAGLATRN